MKRLLVALAALGPLALFVYSSPNVEAQVAAPSPTPTQTEFFEAAKRPLDTKQ